MEIIKQPLLWLASGILIGTGFVSAFSGGWLLLLAGLVIALVMAIRFRHRWRGWPAILYGAGASITTLLLPYVLHPPPCVAGSGSGCYQAFTIDVFVVAVVLAAVGIGLAIVEVRGWRRP